MFYPLTGSQIFGFSPNNPRCYASTTLLQHKKTLFAFASDNNIFIFDRLTLKSQIIAIHDISYQVIAIAFTGHGNFTSIFVALENGKLFSYLLSDLTKPTMEINLGFIPYSMTASNEYLFCKSGPILYAIPITYNSINLKEKIILSETLVHDKCLISPCGRCLATYTKGAKYPVFWYAPFERRRRSNLPMDGHISDFQWGSSDRLLGVTASVEGIVRIWEESTTSYELRCVKWFDYGCRVLSAAIVASADVENQIELKSCQKAASDSGRVFPAVKRQKVLIMASVESGKSTICILKEKKRPQLFPVGRLVISYESPIANFCDMKRIFSEGELKMLISMIRFSPSSLDFDQFELGMSKISHTTPLRIPFIQSPVVSIEKQARILTHHQDGSLYDWWKLTKKDDKCEYLGTSEFKGGNITVTSKEIIFEISKKITDEKSNINQEIQKFKFDNAVNFATIMKYEKNAIIAAINLDEIYIVFLNVKEGNKFKIIKFDRIHVNNESQNILSVTVHSTDLFVLSTSKSVDAYFYVNNKYIKIASLNTENSCSLFIPHPMALIAVSSRENLKLYIVWSNRFIPIEEFDENLKNDYLYPLFNAMNLSEEGSIIAATKHCLYDLEFYATDFPIPYPLDNNLILNTSFTLCYFYLLSEILNGHKITIDSYKVKMQSEMFTFPKEPPKGIANAIVETCKRPPPSWVNLDENGLRFLFSWKLVNGSDMKDLYYLVPFFCIWALLSTDQSSLITSLNPTSAKMIYNMKIEIWVKDIAVLTKSLTNLVEETIPSDEEFDTYIFFCILLNKKATAKRIARIKHQQKLENFFSFGDEIDNKEKMAKKIEKSAFEAQKLHRNALAAMFFTLKGLKKQALIVLKDDLPLYLIALRLFNVENWFESIPNDYVNGFFTKWWHYYLKQKEYLSKFNGKIDSESSTEVEALKEDAVISLKNWNFQKSEKISIEMHKLEMLKKLNASQPSDWLSIQLTPGFIEMQALEESSELINALNLTSADKSNSSEAAEQKNKSNEDEDDNENIENDNQISLDKKKNSLSFFDFGGEMDDWGIDYSSSEEEEEYNKENENDEIEKELFKKENKITQKLFDSNFHTICQLYPFNSPGPICYTFNEKFIVFLISSLFNETYNNGTIKLITHVSDVLYQKAKTPKPKPNIPVPTSPRVHLPRRNSSCKSSTVDPSIKKKTSIIIAILYSLTYAFSKPNMMMTLFSNPLTLESLGPLVAEFVNRKIKDKHKNQPNILKRFVEENVTVDENDRQLANFISFNEICKVLIRQGLLSKIQMLISFFHHRNRLMFSDLNSFTFTQKNYILDLETIGLRCNDIFEQIRLNMMNRKWRVTMVNQFISPFYYGDHFQCTKSFEKHSTKYKTKELSSSSSTDSLESEVVKGSDINEASFAFDTSSIKSKSSFNIKEAEKKKLMPTSSSSSNLYSSSASNKISPPSILAVCVNSQNLTEVAIGGKYGVEFIDISKQDTLNSSASNPSLSNIQPSLIDLVDSFVDTDEQFFQKLNRESGMTKSVSTTFPKKASVNNKFGVSARNKYLSMLDDYKNDHDINISPSANKNSMIRSSSIDAQNKNEGNAPVYIDPYDSPFVSLMGQAKINSANKNFNEKKGFFYQKREFDPAWSKDKVQLKDLDVTCMASHPREAYFIIGTVDGHLYMASFGKKSTISSVLYNESPVTSLELNDTGDRLLAALENGYIYVSDFKTANLYVSVGGATVAWLNNDTQFIVCEPMNKQFVIYDIIAGLSPVAIYQIPQSIRINTFPKDCYSFSGATYAQKHKSKAFSRKKEKRKPLFSQPSKIPIAVFGQQVITGHEDGTVLQFDLRFQDFTCLKLHNSPVTTIKIDRSERFFISGSSDNSLKIVNTMVASTPQKLREVFSSYDHIPNDEPKGVTDIAITDQTIVAVGHSSTIHVWTANEPRGLL